MRYLCIFTFLLLSFRNAQSKPFENEVFDENIRTIVCNEVFNLGQQVVIKFDYMGEDAPYMLAKIIHCDWNWEQSNLVENEYFREFNEFRLNDVEMTGSTKMPYYHYRLSMPPPKLTGNYIIQVYDEDEPSIIYFNRRIMFYGNEIIIGGRNNYSNVVRNRFVNQQVNFSLQYGAYEIQDPYETVHVVIRQNRRWDNAKSQLKPSFIDINTHRLEYNFFDGESSFPALREYRTFDMLTRRFNVENRIIENEADTYLLRADINRSNLNYESSVDNNGAFEIVSPIDADYAYVVFTLKSEKVDDDVYVFGQLSDWKLDKRFKMEYDSSLFLYQAKIPLKQGEYDYNYAVDRDGEADEIYFQGSQSRTINDYEIIIYHRPFGKYYDKIIGYKKL